MTLTLGLPPALPLQLPLSLHLPPGPATWPSPNPCFCRASALPTTFRLAPIHALAVSQRLTRTLTQYPDVALALAGRLTLIPPCLPLPLCHWH